MLSSPPSITISALILRDLDALTLEDAIGKVLKLQFGVSVKQCEIMRDDVTKVSRCFAFVELASLADSRKVVDYYRNNPDRVFELSGKAVTIDYAKNTFNTIMLSYKEALAKRFEDTYEAPVHETSNYDANAAAAVAHAALNQKKMQKKGSSSSSSSATTVSSSATQSGDTGNINSNVNGSTESGVSFDLIVNGQRFSSVPTNPFNMKNIGSAKFAAPDTAKFLFDQSTQYYYDPVTGLYYDSNSQYFFDRLSQKYVYWDPAKCTYVPVDVPSPAASTVEPGKTNPPKVLSDLCVIFKYDPP